MIRNYFIVSFCLRSIFDGDRGPPTSIKATDIRDTLLLEWCFWDRKEGQRAGFPVLEILLSRGGPIFRYKRPYQNVVRLRRGAWLECYADLLKDPKWTFRRSVNPFGKNPRARLDLLTKIVVERTEGWQR
jgi:hypothetical protein